MVTNYVLAHLGRFKTILFGFYVVTMLFYLLLGAGDIRQRLIVTLLSPALLVLTFGASRFVLGVQARNPFASTRVLGIWCDLVLCGSLFGLIAVIPTIVGSRDVRSLVVPMAEGLVAGTVSTKRNLSAGGSRRSS